MLFLFFLFFIGHQLRSCPNPPCLAMGEPCMKAKMAAGRPARRSDPPVSLKTQTQFSSWTIALGCVFERVGGPERAPALASNMVTERSPTALPLRSKEVWRPRSGERCAACIGIERSAEGRAKPKLRSWFHKRKKRKKEKLKKPKAPLTGG